MTTHFARLNIQLSSDAISDQWQKFLNDAAINGYADEYEIFCLDQQGIVGVSIPYEVEDPMSLLEAGAVLGFCQCQSEQSEIGCIKSMWMSLHDSHESTVDSPII